MIDWLRSEMEKDKVGLELSKKEFINEIKSINKTHIFKEKPKLTLWQRIKTVLTGI
jgi:hypothetical protein